MRRIFIIDEHASSKQNGIGTYMRQLTTCLKGSENELNIISFNDDEKEFTIVKKESITYYQYPVIAGGKFRYNAPLLLGLLKLYVSDYSQNIFFINHSPCRDFLRTLKEIYPLSKQIFVIHDFGWTTPLLGHRPTLEKVLKKRCRSSKSINNDRFVQTYCAEERAMYRLVDKVVCLTQDSNRLLQEVYRVPAHKIAIIPNGRIFDTVSTQKTDKDTIRQNLGIDKNDKILLYVGRTTPPKGMNVLLQAFEQVYRQHPEVRLVIAGQIFSLNEFARLTPTSVSRIIYTGLITPELLNKWYQIADIGLLPSYSEQCSYTGMEMLSHGLLIVTTDAQGIREMFQHNRNALAATIGNREKPTEFIQHLTETLLHALHLPLEDQKRLCLQAQTDANNRYTLIHMKHGYQQLLNTLL